MTQRLIFCHLFPKMTLQEWLVLRCYANALLAIQQLVVLIILFFPSCGIKNKPAHVNILKLRQRWLANCWWEQAENEQRPVSCNLWLIVFGFYFSGAERCLKCSVKLIFLSFLYEEQLFKSVGVKFRKLCSIMKILSLNKFCRCFSERKRLIKSSNLKLSKNR